MITFNRFCEWLEMCRHRLAFGFLIGLTGVGTQIMLVTVSLKVLPVLSSLGGEAVPGD